MQKQTTGAAARMAPEKSNFSVVGANRQHKQAPRRDDQLKPTPGAGAVAFHPPETAPKVMRKAA